MTLCRADVHFAVERRLEGGVNAAFGDALQVRLAQRHVHHVPAVVAGHPFDIAGKPEACQHTVGIVVGAAADEGHHPGDWGCTERLGAQADRDPLELVGFVTGDQQLHLAALRRQGGEIVLHQLDTRRGGQLPEACHAVA